MRRAFSLIELLVIIAIVGVLGSILFPIFAQTAQRKSNTFNLKKLEQAGFHYSQDYDGFVPIAINGPYRDLRNVHDGELTQYGEQRSDMWPLLLLPYLKDRALYVNPELGDPHGIYAGPPLATSDPGFDPYANTYRNQSRFPQFGDNYLFVSPMSIPASKFTEPTPTDFMVGVPHQFDEADDPGNTVFFTTSDRGYVPTTSSDVLGTLNTTRGFFGIEAPGLWDVLISSIVLGPVIFWTGANCSGDWCGDGDPNTPGNQPRTNFFYANQSSQGNNVLFMDGHVAFKTAADLAAGTDYLTATPEDGGTGYFGGGAHITDKSMYLWNLNDIYYGA